MKYLLDTHTFLWSLFSPENLSIKSSDIIEAAENEIYISMITFWKISLKYNIGKIDLENVQPEEFPDLAKKSGFEIFNLNEYDVSSFHKLPRYSHKDPFDRLLIWQAIQNNLIVISRDNNFKEYKSHGLSLLW